MTQVQEYLQQIRRYILPGRLLETAEQLIGIPSPTRNARACADRLAKILVDDGFEVERPEAGWPEAPAVAARYWGTERGRVAQFNGHLDTVHLPFVPPRVENGMLYGSGASDMKGGVAAMCEAMRAVRDSGLLRRGGILLTGHDLHESPWGDGSQVDRLIDAGYLGDGVLLPEYFADKLPVVSRGMAIVRVKLGRSGEPMHEVLGGMEQPNVIFAGAELVRRIQQLDQQLSPQVHPLGVRESVFTGQIAAGEIYNQSPTEFRLAGTRRWLPGNDARRVEGDFRRMVEETAKTTGVRGETEFIFVRDAMQLDEADPFVVAFQQACAAVMGKPLERGSKPFVDDGNTFSARGKIAAITHGPNAKGAHTTDEVVSVDELVRVATLYALTVLCFCQGD